MTDNALRNLFIFIVLLAILGTILAIVPILTTGQPLVPPGNAAPGTLICLSRNGIACPITY